MGASAKRRLTQMSTNFKKREPAKYAYFAEQVQRLAYSRFTESKKV